MSCPLISVYIGNIDGYLTTVIMHKKKAKDEIRTRDPNLGKVMLYQLSYFRMVDINIAVMIIFECIECVNIPGT